MIILLEIIRGLAALWVFLFHVKDLFKDSIPWLYDFALHGSLGVPMFFVISGFVITYSAESILNHNNSPNLFLKKRLLRIYPTYWASVLVILILPWLIESISILKSGVFIRPDSIVTQFSVTEAVHFLALSTVFFAESNDIQIQFNMVNSVYWSIAIEIQFYLMIFLFMYFKRYYRYCLVLLTVISFIHIMYPLPLNHGLFLRYWPMFSFGILLAYTFKSKWALKDLVFKHKYTKAFISLVLSIIAIVCLWVTVQSKFGTISFGFLFAILLWAISPIENILLKYNNSGLLANCLLKPFLYLGAMSYSVYLLHGKLFQLPEMFVRQILSASSPFYGLAIIVLTLLLCFPFYYFIEKRFMSKTDRKAT